MRYVVGDYFVPVLLVLLLFALWFSGRGPGERTRHQRAALYGLAGLGLANLLIVGLNHFYFRPRPFAAGEVTLLFYPATDSSFPANSVAVAFAAATGLLLGSRWLGAAGLGLAALLAFARVYVGVHYPLDVLAGAAIGSGMTLLFSSVFPRLRPVPTLAQRLLRWMYLA